MAAELFDVACQRYGAAILEADGPFVMEQIAILAAAGHFERESGGPGAGADMMPAGMPVATEWGI